MIEELSHFHLVETRKLITATLNKNSVKVEQKGQRLILIERVLTGSQFHNWQEWFENGLIFHLATQQVQGDEIFRSKDLVFDKSKVNEVYFSLNYDIKDKIQVLQDLNLSMLYLDISLIPIDRRMEHEIPYVIQKMSNLKSLCLNVQSCFSKEENITQIIESLSALQNLENLQLNLKKNDIGNDTLYQLSNTLMALGNLQCIDLNLSENQFGKEGVKHLSDCISQSTKLSCLMLDLTDCKIQQDGARELFRAVSTITCLESLNLNFYKSGLVLEQKFTSFELAQLTQLKQLNLNLRDNKIILNEYQSISLTISFLTNLTVFKLDVAEILTQNVGIGLLIKGIKHLKRLEELDLNLHNNFIDNPESEFDDLGCLTNLLSLHINLWQNYIGRPGAQSISRAISKMTKLGVLSLNFYANQIEDQGIISLAGALRENKNLIHLSLDLGRNSITDNGIRDLAISIRDLIQLETLNIVVRGNQHVKDLKMITESLSNLHHFYQLSLDASAYVVLQQDLGIEEFKKTIDLGIDTYNIKNLSSLQLDLTGQINIKQFWSSGIQNLTKLTALHLNMNEKALKVNDFMDIISYIGSATNLQFLVLNLENCNLDHSHIKALLLKLTQFKFLNHLSLYLEGNSVFLQNLAEALQFFKNLGVVIINLGENLKTPTNKITMFFRKLFKLANLYMVDIDILDEILVKLKNSPTYNCNKILRCLYRIPFVRTFSYLQNLPDDKIKRLLNIEAQMKSMINKKQKAVHDDRSSSQLCKQKKYI